MELARLFKPNDWSSPTLEIHDRDGKPVLTVARCYVDHIDIENGDKVEIIIMGELAPVQPKDGPTEEEA